MIQHLISVLLFLSIISLIGCASFKKTKPQINEKELPVSCEGIIELIRAKWKKHKELDYYDKDKIFLDNLLNEYKDCFIGLPVEAAIKLLGDTPIDLFGDPFRKWGEHFYLYYLAPGCIGYPKDCEILSFRIKDGVIKNIGVTKYEFIED